MLRRPALAGLILGLAATRSLAQRPAHPIVRPPRPGGPIGPGRYPRAEDAAVNPQPPGIYVVRAVNERDGILRLSDASGRTEDVAVSPQVFELSELKPGDEVLVDFLVPQDGSSRLVAGSVWLR